jgi:hypothetical protein
LITTEDLLHSKTPKPFCFFSWASHAVGTVTLLGKLP